MFDRVLVLEIELLNRMMKIFPQLPDKFFQNILFLNPTKLLFYPYLLFLDPSSLELLFLNFPRMFIYVQNWLLIPLKRYFFSLNISIKTLSIHKRLLMIDQPSLACFKFLRIQSPQAILRNPVGLKYRYMFPLHEVVNPAIQ